VPAAPAVRRDIASCASARVGQSFTDPGESFARACLQGRELVVLERGVEPGDLVVFEDQIGVVLETAQGRIKFAYPRRKRIFEGLVTPRDPHRRRDRSGRIANSFLRPIRPGEPRRLPRLAGELLRGFRRAVE
jgi:hypothetical protein